jgi:hypothetical protein
VQHVSDQVAALGIVVGYLYAGELALLAIPGVNTVYPYLPGGATAALNDFVYLTESMAQQTGNTISPLVSATAGAVILAGYSTLAAILAVAFRFAATSPDSVPVTLQENAISSVEAVCRFRDASAISCGDRRLTQRSFTVQS